MLERGKWRSPAAGFGNVMHAGVGAWWDALDRRLTGAEAQQFALQALADSWAAEAIESEKYTFGQAENMLQQYFGMGKLAGLFEGTDEFRLVTLEDRLEIAIDGWRLRFKNDRVLHNLTQDKLLLIDTKTSSRPDARWRAGWPRSLQMKLYRFANREAYGREVDILIEGLATKAKHIGPHYVVLPQWSDALLAEAVESFKYVVSQDEALLRRAQDAEGVVNLERFEELALTATHTNEQDCNSFGMECPFRPLCDAEPEERQSLLHAEYVEIKQDY